MSIAVTDEGKDCRPDGCAVDVFQAGTAQKTRRGSGLPVRIAMAKVLGAPGIP
jgi:hypothetical protein